MAQPLVIAHHLIWTAYGCWLPNDPRGGGSRSVASDRIAELGELHFGRRREQPPREVVLDFYDRATEVLKYPLSRFGTKKIVAIAESFSPVSPQPCVSITGR